MPRTLESEAKRVFAAAFRQAQALNVGLERTTLWRDQRHLRTCCGLVVLEPGQSARFVTHIMCADDRVLSLAWDRQSLVSAIYPWMAQACRTLSVLWYAPDAYWAAYRDLEGV